MKNPLGFWIFPVSVGQKVGRVFGYTQHVNIYIVLSTNFYFIIYLSGLQMVKEFHQTHHQ